ncbi:unnamed protein product [Adineta ricciae]|uniref:Uncharacterized protein n=1 Tax=Adineta ricciae TaxID=249248 RepID=A0A816D5N2_ADIRI|nr:unnamed protein product [Adineta ricciae]
MDPNILRRIRHEEDMVGVSVLAENVQYRNMRETELQLLYPKQPPRLLWHGRFRPIRFQSFPDRFLQTSSWKRSGTDRIFSAQFRPESGGKEPVGTCWNREELNRSRLRFQRIQSLE